ncbi:cobW-domain-containing protein [Fragilariopsis cylindrus CCMP1102]|uniref:CobW-domain-containing protein n=1 Tax=Fragilariopsis cylindrus CCMP1102 TaxID=635003 RepID=A0A1E7EZD5_9STRA|nr:cobW-domain-containing protein [Fragilariopsis cylindrus CCMP1102]|eukprot:OEU11368.1 cobW-domain-containing protein [Fragilariopsis cylindrus CCMP1102]
MLCGKGSESESIRTTIGTTIIDDDDEQSKKKIPIHLLAGFLGSGKTTTLKHILENMDHGLKIGIIVNDVASVNIDAKFILSSSSSSISSNDKDKDNDAITTTTAASNDSIINDDIVELQNGCACCSLAGELFDSIESLLLRTTSSTTGMYDAIIVELSGVADPIAIQNNWRDVINNNKESYGTLVTNRTEIGNIITVVDATTFSSDYMTFDILKDRTEWYATPTATTATKQKLPHSVNRQVVELLAEQIEAASIVIVNKQDIASTNEVVIAMELIKSLNVDANIIATSNGQIDIQNVLGVQVWPDETTSLDNDDDDDDNDNCKDPSHSHSHDDHVPITATTTTCDDTDCTDPSHSHSHDDHVTATTCEDTGCTDSSHTHSHEHDHSSSTTTCDDTDCTDPSHSHDHSSGTTCEDTDCTDPTHSHSHEHDHSSSSGSTSMTSTTNLGISNFVYKASKPFNANRLMKLIWSWPIPIKDELDFITLDFNNDNDNDNEEEDAEKVNYEDQSLAKIGYGVDNNDDDSDDDSTTTTTTTSSSSPFIGVLRSKGFCWIAPTAWDGLLEDSWRHDKAMYWSHAGKHMGIQMGGNFWASISEITMKDFFSQKPNEYHRILKDDFITKEFGDRRQKLFLLVFNY